jgi:Rrf2 family protein
MISQSVEYALRAMVTLAQRDPNPCTSQGLAEITRVPGPYLSKLMRALVRSGLVHSQRGPHGGFELMKKPKQLTIWDVVESVDPLRRIRECPLGLKDHGRALCPLHRQLDDSMAMVEETFRNIRLSDLLGEPGSITPLCESRGFVQLSGIPPANPRKTRKKRKGANHDKS